MTLPRFQAFLPFIAVTLAAQAAVAQTNTTSGGGESAGSFTVSFQTGDTQFANLSLYDCMHSEDIDFEFVSTFESGQEAEYLLSTSSDCELPASGLQVSGGTSCASDTAGCPSMILEPEVELTNPADGMTTDWGSTSPPYSLTTGGMWDFYSVQSASTTSNTTDTYGSTQENNTTVCPTGVNQLVYICVWLSETSASTVPVFGSLSISIDSTPPAAPGQPTVTSLDSGLSVTWPAVSNAFYYTAYAVQTAGPTADGGVVDAGSDAGATDAGSSDGGADGGSPVIAAQQTVNNETTATLTGLTNGATYSVYVVALDDSGTNPPTTSNISSPSPSATGSPVPSYGYFYWYEKDGGKELGGCASAGAPLAACLLVLFLLLRRRQRRRASLGAGLFLFAVLTAWGAGSARAADQPENTSIVPVVREPSPEWFRLEAMLGPYNPNPDSEAGLTGTPYKTVFPHGNNLLWHVEFFVNFFNKFGHLSAGVALGLWQNNGHALLISGKQAGDVESLTLYPITPMLSYRADFIYSKWNVPVIPYGKVGWGFVPWTDTKDGKITSGVNAAGQKWISEGWAMGLEWAAGIEFPLDFLDPRRSFALDDDFGINQVGIFGEYGMSYWKGTNGGLPLGGMMISGGLYLAF